MINESQLCIITTVVHDARARVVARCTCSCTTPTDTYVMSRYLSLGTDDSFSQQAERGSELCTVIHLDNCSRLCVTTTWRWRHRVLWDIKKTWNRTWQVTSAKHIAGKLVTSTIVELVASRPHPSIHTSLGHLVTEHRPSMIKSNVVASLLCWCNASPCCSLLTDCHLAFIDRFPTDNDVIVHQVTCRTACVGL